MADDEEKPKPTYDELEAENTVLKATVSRLSERVGKQEEQIAALRKPKPGLVLDPESPDRFRRPLGRR
jgi:hypothetical protein